MIQPSLVLDVQPTLRGLSGLAANQVPFATALALTNTAKDAQQQVRDEELPKRFTLRNRWVQQGIRIVPATKRTLAAVVGSRDAFMALQETGGTKRPRSSKNIAVPGLGVRRTKRGLVPKAQRPRNLLDRRRIFVNQIRGGTVAILQRLTPKRYPLRVLWVLSPKAEVDKRFGFQATVEQVVQRRWSRNFVAAMVRALGSRK